MPKRRGRDTGSVTDYVRGDKHLGWRAAYCVTPDGGGKPLRGSKVFRKPKHVKADAEKWLKQQLDAPAAGGTVGEWLTEWLGLYKARVSLGAYRSDRVNVEKRIRPALGPLRLRDLTRLKVVKFVAGLKDTCTPDQRHKTAKILRTLLNDAAEFGQVPAGLTHRLKIPAAPKPQTRSLTPGELAAVLDAADALGFDAMFRVWLDLGLRPSELLALRWEDYDPARGKMAVVRTMDPSTNAAKPPKTPREAPLRLGAEARRRLEQFRAGQTTGVMFPAPGGGHWWQNNYKPAVWGPVMKRAGVTAGRYILRHTCATDLLRAGVPIKTVSKRLGHSDPAMTLRVYAHVLPDDQDLAAAAWDGILAALPKVSPRQGNMESIKS